MNDQTDWNDIRLRYRQARQLGFELCNKHIFPKLPRIELIDAAEALGMLGPEMQIMLRSEEEMPILVNYALYGMRIGGETAVQAYRRMQAATVESETTRHLDKMAEARYGLLTVKSIVNDCGIVVQDDWRGRERLLIDFGLAASLTPGYGLLTHYTDYDDFIMTTGSALPLTRSQAHVIRSSFLPYFTLEHASYDELSPEEMSDFEGNLIALALERGAAESIRYRLPKNLTGKSHKGLTNQHKKSPKKSKSKR